jgi:surfeit locus 1 family protein
MTISGWRFTPKLWSTVLAALVIVTMLQLGNWQLSRAREKESRQEQLDTLSREPAVALPEVPVKLEEFQYRRVEARGVYVPAHTIFLDNKINQGAVGYHVITPLRIGNSSMHVLVNRGWIAADLDRTKLPSIATPQGSVTVSGTATTASQKTLELSKEVVSGPVWANLDPQRYASITGLAVQPVMILQQDDLNDGLVRKWRRPDSGSAKNWGYAFQWFAMALAVLIIYLVLSVKRERSKNT